MATTAPTPKPTAKPISVPTPKTAHYGAHHQGHAKPYDRSPRRGQPHRRCRCQRHSRRRTLRSYQQVINAPHMPLALDENLLQVKDVPPWFNSGPQSTCAWHKHRTGDLTLNPSNPMVYHMSVAAH